MKKLLTITTFTLLLLALFTACQSGRREYVIGVSQCSADIWRV